MNTHPTTRRQGRGRRQAGAGLVEATVVLPAFFFMVLGVMQAGLVFHAKSSVNYAAHEAARAGTVHNASVASITAAFHKGMMGYYGGGRTVGELAATAGKMAKDLTNTAMRVEILSPTQESFQDFASPKAKEALKAGDLVIPNVGLETLQCPRDVPGCNKDPKSNKSGQTLADANLLKLRITYGIPRAKQMPLVGPVYTWALDTLGSVAGDPFAEALVKAGRIPVVVHTVLRMQSDAIRNSAMASIPGAGGGDGGGSGGGGSGGGGSGGGGSGGGGSGGGGSGGGGSGGGGSGGGGSGGGGSGGGGSGGGDGGGCV